RELDQTELGDIAADGRLGGLEPALGELVRELLLTADLPTRDEVADLLLPRSTSGTPVGRDPTRRARSVHRSTIRLRRRSGRGQSRPRRRAASASSAATRPGAVPPITSGRASAAGI